MIYVADAAKWVYVFLRSTRRDAMRVELLPGMTNVVRFPVERRARPTLELLREIAPDVRKVLSLAEAFGIEPPVHDLRERADAATADYIAIQVPQDAPAREVMLAGLERPVVERAVAACRSAYDASLEASEAQQLLLAAQTTGRFWIDGLRERAEALTGRAATLLLTAHARAEEAEGVVRAVGLARRGARWAPRSVVDDMDTLIAVQLAAG
jgi:hypothetical protein